MTIYKLVIHEKEGNRTVQYLTLPSSKRDTHRQRIEEIMDREWEHEGWSDYILIELGEA
jgi:hypothetical protein